MIKKDLERWQRIHPTLYGKRLITQAVIGGRTQYLAKVQGMPEETANVIQKLLQNFLWDGETVPRIAPSTLQLPLEEGGLNLLNVKMRNEAIDVMWLRSYLNFSPSRPTWAVITDLLINTTAPPSISPLGRFNTYMQTWNPPARGPRSALLNDDIMRMINTAKRYKTNLAALRIAPDINARLPAWYHVRANPRPLTSIPSKCLLKKHNVKTVADLIRISTRAQPNQSGPHIPNLTCICIECANDRLLGCRNPQECAQEALTRVTAIAPKFNPLIGSTQRDIMSLTTTREMQSTAADENSDKLMFNAEIACKTDLTECFRIFTDPNRLSHIPIRRRHAPGLNLQDQTITVYTDGACFNNGKENAICGSGIWAGPDSHLNTAIRVPGTDQSNQVGEIAAVIKAVSMLPTFCPLIINTDSQYVIKGLTTHLKDWENKGWIGIKNANLFKKAAYLLRKRLAPTFFKWVKGHSGNEGNEQSDILAKEGANKNEPDDLPLEIPPEYDLQGAKLATMTQALAYKGIRLRNPASPRPTTMRNLEQAKNAISELTLGRETDTTLWKGLRKRSICLRVQQFLYKAIHGAYKIGDFWSNIPGYEERGLCPRCRTTESLDHILTSCTAGPVNTIWTLARDTWPHAPELWPNISLGLILGCGTISTPEDKQNESKNGSDDDQENHQRRSDKKGRDRLLQILVSESAHLIWVLRCKRVINERSHVTEEIGSRWLKAINARLTDDKIIATKVQRGKTSINLVKSTWAKALQKNSVIPHNWIYIREVLVGRSARPPR